MNDAISPFIAIPASILIVACGLLALLASIGIVRLNRFVERIHIQAMIYSVALWCLLLASLLVTFNLKDRAFLHEILIGLFIFITSPISSILLVRSFLLREERGHVFDETPGEPESVAPADGADHSQERTDT